jgi:WXG100 family type VII secretion target
MASTNFTFTASEAQKMVTDVQGHADSIKNAMEVLRQGADSIKAAWVGDGASAFENQFLALYTNYENLLKVFAEGMEAASYAAQNYQASDSSAATTINAVDTAKGVAPISFPS